MRLFLLALLRLYKYLLSPWLGTACRFTPTCSEYAGEAIRLHGPSKGLWLALKRVGRCHPLAKHGYDPVDDSVAGADNTHLKESC